MIIGISGKIKSGKDTAFSYIRQCSTSPVIENKFASRLKLMCKNLSGIDDQYSQEGKRQYIPSLDMTVGTLQQKIGEGLRKEVHPDVWINTAFVDCELSDDRLNIFTDLRYPNEADAIKSRGGIVVRINANYDGYHITGRDPNHISETALDDYSEWDYEIDNDADLDSFFRKIDFFMQHFNLI